MHNLFAAVAAPEVDSSPASGTAASAGAPGTRPAPLLAAAYTLCAALLGLVVLVEGARSVFQGGGGDFWAFWAAGRALDRGLDPYSPTVWQHTPIPPDVARTPFLSPPFFAQLMRPLGMLPFHLAYALWLAASLAGLVAAVAAVFALANVRRSPANLCVTAAVLVAFAPVLQTVTLGQTDTLVVAGLAVGWWLRTRRHPFAAGLSMCAALVDPHMAAPFLLYWAIRAYRTRDGADRLLVAGLVAGIGAAAVLSAMQPGYLGQWVHLLPRAQLAVRGMYNQVTTLRLATALATRAPRLAGATVALAATAALALAVRVWWREPSAAERGMATGALVALAAGTFVYVQDYLLLLLAVPAAVALWRAQRARPLLAALAVVYSAIDAIPLGSVISTWQMTTVGVAPTPGHPVAVMGLEPFLAAATLGIRAATGGQRAERLTPPPPWVRLSAAWTVASVAIVLLTARSLNTLPAATAALAGTGAALAVLASHHDLAPGDVERDPRDP